MDKPKGFITVQDAVRGKVAVNKLFPGDVVAKEFCMMDLQGEIHKIAKKYMNKRKQGYFMGEIRQLMGGTE